jgi:hypothetical protein
MVREPFKGYGRGRSAVFRVRRRRAEGCSIIRINRAAWRVAAAKRFYGGMSASYRLGHPAPGTSEIPPYHRISLFGFTATGRRASRTAGLSGPSLGWEGNILVSNPLNPV